MVCDASLVCLARGAALSAVRLALADNKPPLLMRSEDGYR